MVYSATSYGQLSCLAKYNLTNCWHLIFFIWPINLSIPNSIWLLDYKIWLCIGCYLFWAVYHATWSCFGIRPEKSLQSRPNKGFGSLHKHSRTYNMFIYNRKSNHRLVTSVDMRRDVQEVFRMTPHEKQVMMFSATLPKDIRPVCKKFMQDVNIPLPIFPNNPINNALLVC